MSRAAHGVDAVRLVAERAERRIRLVRAVQMVGRTSCASVLFAIVDVALRKTGVIGEGTARALLTGAGVPVLLAAAAGWGLRLPERAGARALDRFYGLHDRIASALSFAEQAARERTPFMQAAIDDAIAFAHGVSPRRAVPIVLPPSIRVFAGLAAALVALLLFEVRHHRPVAHARTIDSIEMAPDDLEDVKDFLKQIGDRESSDDARAAIDEFNKLVDDIATRRLDRTEVFRRMDALEEKFLPGSAADRKSLEQRLEGIGEPLSKAELARPAGRALADHDLAKGGDALQELAKKMRSTNPPVDKAKLEQLREALKKAGEEAKKSGDELARRREQLADDILATKARIGDAGTDEERSLLEKKEQELERLERDSSEKKGANESLDRLDRELEQAAEDLLKDLGQTADDLDQGAQDLNHMEEQQATQQEKEELRQKLQEMRELLRQQGQAGKSQMVRLKRFGQTARGGQKGESGDGQGDPNDRAGAHDASGQGGPSQSGGAGQPGHEDQNGSGAGSGGQGGETWIVGPNGEKLLMLSKRPSGAAGGQRSAQEGSGERNGTPGGWGLGHDPAVQGKATTSKASAEDTQVQGTDTGQGGSRSQVIQGAAERGFASRNYQKVYTEYHQVAEESLAKDEIPDGYRSFVKRYFQLIRPREER